MAEEQGVTEPSDSPAEFALPSVPDIPHVLPLGMPVDAVHALLDRLDALGDDQARVAVIRDELRAARALAKYLTRWRSFYCSRMWLAEVPALVIAEAAGVASTFISKRARDLGYPMRRSDRRRDG